jgi:hypothetical protein
MRCLQTAIEMQFTFSGIELEYSELFDDCRLLEGPVEGSENARTVRKKLYFEVFITLQGGNNEW